MFISAKLGVADREFYGEKTHRRIINLDSAWIMSGKLYLAEAGADFEYVYPCDDPEKVLGFIEAEILAGKHLCKLDFE